MDPRGASWPTGRGAAAKISWEDLLIALLTSGRLRRLLEVNGVHPPRKRWLPSYTFCSRGETLIAVPAA